MNYELDIYGVFVPSALVCLVAAYGVSAAVRHILRRSGAVRWIWHPALFNFAVFVCLFGVAVYLSSEFI